LLTDFVTICYGYVAPGRRSENRESESSFVNACSTTGAVDLGQSGIARGWLSRATLLRLGWAAALLMLLTYGLVLIGLSPLPLQDYPAHLSRALVMGDLIFHHGSKFGGMFDYHFLFVSYVLGDLGFTAFTELFGPRVGGGLWVALLVASLPAGLLFYLRAVGATAEDRLLAFILGLYLATDWFFVMGFLNFRLGVSLTIVTLGALQLLRGHWSLARYALYAALVVLSYLSHLAALTFISVAVGINSLLALRARTTRLSREILVIAPIAALLFWHFVLINGYTLPGDPAEQPYVWGTLYTKLMRLDAEFLRYNPLGDLLLAEAFAVCLLLRVCRGRVRDLAHPSAQEMLALVAAFVAMYFALPFAYAEAWAVDVRPLALVSVFLLIACISLPTSRAWRAPVGLCSAVVVALALAGANMLHLAVHLRHAQATLNQYRAIIASLPLRARVLPVYTWPLEGDVIPLLHAGSFVTIERQGLTPYAFTADTANPTKYFRYRHGPPSRPDELWYLYPKLGKIDWNGVARDYNYLLITRPFDLSRIQVRTTLVAQNDAAALLAIASPPAPAGPSACCRQ